jgi:hypothetical protein
MADLLVSGGDDDNEDLNDDELNILQDAGMIPKNSKSKGKNRQMLAKHIIFVENEGQSE